MESVLEVADMLEVKGLSRIRSNTSLKKFMGHTTTTPSTNTSCTEETRSECRSECRSPEEQFYHGNQQENRTVESEGVWRRLQGSNAMGDSPGPRESAHTPPTETMSTASLAPTHATSHQTNNTQEEQDETQTSGIDLSLAKNEPWSPRDANKHSGQKEDLEDDGLCPAKKKRKHVRILRSL